MATCRQLKLGSISLVWLNHCSLTAIPVLFPSFVSLLFICFIFAALFLDRPISPLVHHSVSLGERTHPSGVTKDQSGDWRDVYWGQACGSMKWLLLEWRIVPGLSGGINRGISSSTSGPCYCWGLLAYEMCTMAVSWAPVVWWIAYIPL